MIAYQAASAASTVASGGLGSVTAGGAGQGATVTLSADSSGNLSKAVLNIPTASGTFTQTYNYYGPPTPGFSLSSPLTNGKGNIVFALSETYAFPQSTTLMISQLVGAQSLSSSAYGLWGDTTGATRGGTLAFGNLTPAGSVPSTGSATFNGSTIGQGAGGNAIFALQGNVQITANFGTHSVTTNLTNLVTQNISTNAIGALPDLTGASALSGNAYSGSIAGTGVTGTVNGNFYGPATQETAGVWQASAGGNSFIGSYGAK